MRMLAITEGIKIGKEHNIEKSKHKDSVPNSNIHQWNSGDILVSMTLGMKAFYN